MARKRGRRRGFAGWAVGVAAGLGAGAVVLTFLEPARRDRAREALDHVRAGARRALESTRAAARRASERVEAEAAAQASGAPPADAATRRHPAFLGAVLVGRAVLGGGLLRIPFGLLGVRTLARTAASSERGRNTLRRSTEAVQRATGAVRALSRRAAGPAPGAPGLEERPTPAS